MATDNTVIVPNLQSDGSVRTQNLPQAQWIVTDDIGNLFYTTDEQV